ncbi:sugar phosphate isomerase/epimerase family protein [Aporhodopirellula aestuarii]|uniref:Sugar phosphate isomerase/epimerase n=1 Tax=Aporhodopirellula aestuarii TaxID=2950107 RepID=A0ABT0TYE6_9BACT|nr:sugar phosphate isomerase/epimerase family protein [Aporhodopirellula aestuarii]MCM2369600.1 sugar phosphate isomerase/epimerase [Aporhodopirellula aestuarii]
MTVRPDIKWGISTLGCHELDLPAICRLALRHGIQCLEIRSLADCLNLPEYLDATYPNDPAAIEQILAQYHQSIIALNSGFSLTGAKESDRDELLAFARWADQLGIPYIRVFGGGSMDTPLGRNDLAIAVDNLRWWKQQREKHEWMTRIALETHDGFSSAERCLQLQDAFDGPLDIIWDTHHTWKMGDESALQSWEQMASMIRHVHIKDSISVPSARHPYTYCLPGQGEFPAADVYNVLRDNGYRGVISLEWERKWHPYLPDLDTALTALADSGWKAGTPHSVAL